MTELEQIEQARKLLRKAGMRDSLPYWILVHAHNRVELNEDHMFLRVARASRENAKPRTVVSR